VILLAVMMMQSAPVTSDQLSGGSVERDDGSVVIDVLARPVCTSDSGEIVVCADRPETAEAKAAEGEVGGLPKARLAIGKDAALAVTAESVDMNGAISQRAMMTVTVRY